jgi:hypothetical protein
LVLAGSSNGTAKFDLTLIIVDRPALHPDAFEFIWEYSTNAFDTAAVEHIAESYGRVLDRIAADPGTRLAELGFAAAGQ